MTRDQKIAKAKRLSEKGLNHREIGERLGVTTSAVWKWMNVERARELARRTEAKPETKARKRAWDRMNECSICGESCDRAARCCQRCDRERQHEAARKRTVEWLALRKKGLHNVEIAKRFGVAPHVVTMQLQRSRVARFGLAYMPSPYHRNGR